jgi:hypothetical protein
MPQCKQHPYEGNLIPVYQHTESIQAFCKQSWSHFRASQHLKCTLATRKNKVPLMSVSLFYIFICTRKNDVYSGVKTRGVFVQRDYFILPYDLKNRHFNTRTKFLTRKDLGKSHHTLLFSFSFDINLRKLRLNLFCRVAQWFMKSVVLLFSQSLRLWAALLLNEVILYWKRVVIKQERKIYAVSGTWASVQT